METEFLNEQLFSESLEAQEMIIIKTLKPKLSKDGNKWCWLYGENLQVGLVGFGDTPQKAMFDFNSNFYNEEIKDV